MFCLETVCHTLFFQSLNRGIQKTHLRYSSEGLTSHSSRKSAISDGSLKGRELVTPTRLSTSVYPNRHGFMEQTSVSREVLIASLGQSDENYSPEGSSYIRPFVCSNFFFY